MHIGGHRGVDLQSTQRGFAERLKLVGGEGGRGREGVGVD